MLDALMELLIEAWMDIKSMWMILNGMGHAGWLVFALAPITAASSEGEREASKVIVVEELGGMRDTLSPYADFCFRYEADWDSVNAGGMPRGDRHRILVRARFGI